MNAMAMVIVMLASAYVMLVMAVHLVQRNYVHTIVVAMLAHVQMVYAYALKVGGVNTV